MRVAALFLVLHAGLAVAGGLQVRLRASAEVADDFVRLADVAEEADPGLAGVLLGRAPAPGAERTIGREDVRTALRRARPELRALDLSGAEAVVVRRGASRHGIPGAEAVVEAILRWPTLVERARGARVQASVLDLAPEPRTGLPLLVTSGTPRGDVWEFDLLAVDLDGGETRTRAHARLRFEVEALVCRRNLPASHLLTAADLEPRTLEVGLDDGWVAADSPPVGSRLARAMKAGEMLTHVLLRATPVVRSQDRVQIDVHGAGFRVRLEGVAQESGAIGQVIRVRRLDGAELRARVTGAGGVELEEEGKR